ncbi:MAG TPA: ferrous iron transporter B, partial [Acidobacteriaceae bacterium]
MNDCCAPPVVDLPVFTEPKKVGEVRTIALIGPPNSGKSTLFNRLTGLRQKVANYPGVTVEQRMGRMAGVGRNDLTLIDLPGIYSLDAYSEDARVSVEVLRGEMPGTPRPDAVLLVLDSLHLTRQLMLAAPILSLGLPTMVLLNMSDLMDARGGAIDPLLLAKELGAPVALVSAAKGTGLESVQLFLNRLSGEAEQPKLLLPVLGNAQSTHRWAAQVSSRTGYRAPLSAKATQRVDKILLHPVFGPLAFLLIVFGVFQVVFSIGLPLSDAMQNGLADFGRWAVSYLPDGWLRSLALDGAWNGVTAVLVFLPQILLLFLFIGILEDTGYLARAALIADRVMRSIGLNGKAFIPLLSAYACAVPAIMATRTIENKRDRLATILVTPFMTCSARLPVYLLFIAAFIPNVAFLGGLISLKTLVMLGMYVIGFLAALVTARLLKSSILKSSETPFILELPQYRMPTLRSIGIRLFDRSKIFLKQAGTVILCVAVGLWVLANVPVHQGHPPALEESVIGRLGHLIEPVIAPLGFNWKIGIGLLTSVLAREVMVGTMGTLYGADPETQSLSLQTALHHDLTLGGAVALMVFFAFALQCT